MSSFDADKALTEYLSANFTAAPLYFENEEADPPSSSDLGAATRWIYIEIESAEDEQQSIGAGEPLENLWREEGTLTATVLVPVGEGVAEGKKLRDLLADKLRGHTIGGVVVRGINRSPGGPWEGDDGRGRWWALPLTVYWHMDH